MLPALAAAALLLALPGEAGGSVQWLTFYANGNGETAAPGDPARLAAAHANMFTTGNLSALEEAWATHQLAGMLTVDSVWLWHTNPVSKKPEGGLRPGWRAHLTAILSEAVPLVRKGAVRGFFLGDEVCCVQGVPGSNVSTVASIIRHALSSAGLGADSSSPGGAIIYLNECTRAFHNGTRGYLGDKLPAAIDAISLDGYCPSTPNGCSTAAQEAILMRHIYTTQLFPRLLPHQRVFVVPGLFATAPIAHQDDQLVLKWKGYLRWMAKEPLIIGVNSWHYDTWAGDDGLGAGAFPKTLQAVGAFGKTLPPGA